jgi:hypothetical protein
MKNYSVDLDKKWDYENGFYLTCEHGRIGKFLNHLEIYQKIISLPGDIFEFGVYKGTSLMRFLTLRDLLETQSSRKIYGFDSFGKFPDDLDLKSDREFVEQFETAGGFGISDVDLLKFIEIKGSTNVELIAGDIKNTLPNFLTNHSSARAAMIHIDVDVYEPTKIILELMWDKLVKGGILVLDDYGVIAGETIAVEEFFIDKNVMIQKIKHYHTPSYIVKQ